MLTLYTFILISINFTDTFHAPSAISRINYMKILYGLVQFVNNV